MSRTRQVRARRCGAGAPASGRWLGFRAVPHIAARRIGRRAQLRTALADASRQPVSMRFLLIAPVRPLAAAGDFSSTLQILASGALIEAGFRTLGVAGHPEGHKQIGPTSLWAALGEAGVRRAHWQCHAYCHAVWFQSGDRAQLGAAPDRARRSPCRVHVGIAGPPRFRN